MPLAFTVPAFHRGQKLTGGYAQVGAGQTMFNDNDVDMLTVGQYLQPSRHHLPVARFVHPDEFRMFEAEAAKMGFVNSACGPMVRSSYHADRQAAEAGIA